MQVICKDGTTIQCQDFQATDSGVLLFEETAGFGEESEDEEEDEEERAAVGFVPVTELRFVLSDELVQRQASAQRAQPEPGQRGAMPGGAQAPPAGQMVQQQQAQQPPGAPGQQPRGPGGQ